jgi:uroporphyrinogen-III synthase
MKSRTTIRKRPLTGQRILVGRARHQAGKLSIGLRKLGAQVLEIPFIEIRKPRSYRPMDAAIRKLGDYDWLILTSVNGVDAFWQRLSKHRRNKKHLAHLRIAAIGPATRNEIEKRGLRVNVVPAEYIAESVVASLRAQIAGQRVLLARARVARDVIPKELRRLGAEVDVVEAYETVAPKASRTKLRAAFASAGQRPTVVTFTSSSTVRNFVALVGKSTAHAAAGSGTRFASIGPVTSATLRELGLPVHIEAADYTIPGLLRAIATGTVSD